MTIGRRWWILGELGGLFLLLNLAKPLMPWGTSVVLLFGGGLILQGVALEWIRDRFLVRLSWSCLIVRAMLSLSVYLISLGGLSVLSSLQLGGGFWTFASDAIEHHRAARWILEAWTHGTEAPEGFGWYCFLLAGVYAVMGLHALHGIFLNALIGAASALLAYSVTKRLGTIRSARLAAILVAFWPSTVWWSTQLLKEQFTVFLVLLTFYFFVETCQRLSAFRGPSGSDRLKVGLRIAGLVGAVFLMAFTRPFYALAFGLSVLLVLGLWTLRGFLHRVQRMVCLFTAVLVLMTALIGRVVNPHQLFSPRRPWMGHTRLGIEALERGNRSEARREFVRALELNPAYELAQIQLLRLTVQEGSGTRQLPASEGPSQPPPTAKPSSAVPEVKAPRPAQSPGVAPQAQAASPARLPTPESVMMVELKRLPSTIKDFWKQFIRLPSTITSLRDGQMSAAGHSRIHPEADLSSFGSLLWYLPQGLFVTLFSPLPWQVFEFDAAGTAGVLTLLAIPETCVVYCLLIFACLRTRRCMRTGTMSEWVLILYFCLGSIGLALTMVNLGNLFRYRVPIFLAMFILASLGGLPEWLMRIRGRLSFRKS